MDWCVGAFYLVTTRWNVERATIRREIESGSKRKFENQGASQSYHRARV